MVLGKLYKENEILLLFLYVLLLATSITGIVLIFVYIEKLIFKISLIVLVLTLIILISLIPYYLYKYKRIPNNIIIFNVIDATITINTYKKNYIVKISDIAYITIHNLGTKFLFGDRIEEGKLCFFLIDGTKIKTLEIDNVYDAYNKLDEIVFVDRNNKEVLKEQLIDKLEGWGSKKEYKAIVSILVALFIPFFGLFFISNQNDFKKLKNGKPTGLMAIAYIISAFWILVILFVIYLL